jgi:hypothetical protein
MDERSFRDKKYLNLFKIIKKIKNFKKIKKINFYL